jgi:hypothetical protein
MVGVSEQLRALRVRSFWVGLRSQPEYFEEPMPKGACS